jgi:hypothetical protein
LSGMLIAEPGASFFFCVNSTVNWIQFLRSLSQTACHATDEIFSHRAPRQSRSSRE